MPWPFYNRDLLSYGYGIDMMDHSNSILVVIHSVPDTDHYKHPDVEIPPENTSTCARMELKYAGILIKPISQQKTYVSLIASCDPKFSYIPGKY
jgi:S-adenosylhomocysteine hydrolase